MALYVGMQSRTSLSEKWILLLVLSVSLQSPAFSCWEEQMNSFYFVEHLLYLALWPVQGAGMALFSGAPTGD